MKLYTPKTFNIPELKGISSKTIEEHLKLYEGYVKHTNLILERIEKNELDEYTLGELRRRLGFEFDGMRNHEYYFTSLENGPAQLSENSVLKEKIVEDFGSYETWMNNFKTLAKTRGIGWAMLYFDKNNDQLINTWVDEQHFGHLIGLAPILTLDMWEHSFVADYQPSGKGQYVDDFFENINWEVIERNFIKVK